MHKRIKYIRKKVKSTKGLLKGITKDCFILAKKYPKIALVVLVFHAWLYTVGVNHIKEFKSWWDFIKTFGLN